jgi:hypothetical protein
MECFGVDQALIGDLVEASAARRSLWLWRQAIGAIAVAFARDIAQQPIVVVRAVLVGFMLSIASGILFEWTWDRLATPFLYALPHLGLEHQIALTSGIVRTIMYVPLAFSIGWLVVRLNRTGTPVAVVTFLAVSWYLAAPESWRLLTNSADQARFRPYLVANLLGLLTFTFSVAAGAFLGDRSADAASVVNGGSVI